MKIIYTSEMKNNKINTLSWWSNYMRSKKMFDQNVLKINNNELLSFNRREFNTTMRIFRDNRKQYSIIKNYKYQIIKSTIALKNIMTNLCKNTQKWRKLYNFYNAIVNFFTCDRKSKFILKSILIINRISMQLTLNTIRFTMQNHR